MPNLRKHPALLIALLGFLLFLGACLPSENQAPTLPDPSSRGPLRHTSTNPPLTSTFVGTSAPPPVAPELPPPDTPKPADQLADVVSVATSGDAESYSFIVEVASPDEGCHRFADWWEVLSEDGDLIYRRILLHSHVNEQPFTRSGGPVNISLDEVVLVRAHMSTGGYGGRAMRGSPGAGFETIELESEAFNEVEREPPQPADCDF
jgi:hypothetical protein